MTVHSQAGVRFIELMSALFQLEEAKSLDFGLYRMIRRHNRQVRQFLGEVADERGGKVLKGGRLADILDAAFAVGDDESTAEDQYRLKELANQLGVSSAMSKDQLESELTRLEKIPATRAMVEEYRNRREQMVSGSTAQADRNEVLNRLFQFFDRHYQDGDFIVERRYGRDGSRYIRSTGDDMEFHFATEDMYYVKSGDIFTDYPVQLLHGQRLLFTVEPEALVEPF